MTGGCSTYPIYYHKVIGVDTGSVIIRYKKNRLAYQKEALGRGTPAAMFQARLGRAVEPCSPAAMFQA